MKPKKSVLFVCKGNIFRSPVGEMLLKKFVGKKITVYSAGISKKDVGKKSIKNIGIARRFGVDISKHRAKLLTRDKVKKYDIILVFDKYIKKFIQKKYPESRGKVFLVKKYAGYKTDLEIHDLKGTPEEAHENFIKEMIPLIKKISKKIL